MRGDSRGKERGREAREVRGDSRGKERGREAREVRGDSRGKERGREGSEEERGGGEKEKQKIEKRMESKVRQCWQGRIKVGEKKGHRCGVTIILTKHSATMKTGRWHNVVASKHNINNTPDHAKLKVDIYSQWGWGRGGIGLRHLCVQVKSVGNNKE